MALGRQATVSSHHEGRRRTWSATSASASSTCVLSTGANWTAAGESLTPAMVGLTKITFAECNLGVSSTPTAFQVRYDYTNKKLIAFAQAVAGAAVALVAVTGNTDLSTFTARIRFEGW
jgi:hypothetical protein